MSSPQWYPPAPPLGPELGPAAAPAPRRRSWLPLAASIAALVVAVVAAGAGVTLEAAKSVKERKNAPDTSTYLAGVDPKARDAAFTELLNRRSAAVRAKNKDAFLADVDRARPGLLDAQTREYDTLVRMPFASFEYKLQPTISYELRGSIRNDTARYRIKVAPGVVNTFRLDGMDTLDTAVPFVPILGRVGDRWLLVGEAGDQDLVGTLPPGFSGDAWLPNRAFVQPWQGDAASVLTSTNVVLVYSPQDEAKASGWSQRIETAIRNVKVVRPDKWSGKVYAVATRDTQTNPMFDKQYTSAAAQRQSTVSRWTTNSPDGPAKFTGNIVLLNPDELNDVEDNAVWLFDDVITNAAMAPVRSSNTPKWLLEGLPRFVNDGGKTHRIMNREWSKAHLPGKDLSQLPASDTFYSIPENFNLSWQACEVVAEEYGTGKLLALYEWFQNRAEDSPAGWDKATREVLGVPLTTLTAQWVKDVQTSMA